jgi:hypothetical protein
LSTKSAVVFPSNNPLAPPPFPAWFPPPPPPPTITTTIVGWLLASFPGTILALEIGSLLPPHKRKKERKKERPKKLFPNKKTTTTTTTKEQECDLHQELSIWKLQQVVTPLGQKKLGKKNTNKTAIL